jgi:hypothetical protein
VFVPSLSGQMIIWKPDENGSKKGASRTAGSPR